MARNKSRKGNSKVAKKSNFSRFRPSRRWLFASVRVNVILMLVFVLAVASAGTYFYKKSYACGNYPYVCYNIHCPEDGIDYGYSPNRNYGYCIGWIKGAFDDISNDTGYNFIWASPTDWYWGWRVSDNTYAFQRAWGLSQDGIAGPETIGRICATLKNHWDGHGDLWADYNNLGCNNGYWGE